MFVIFAGANEAIHRRDTGYSLLRRLYLAEWNTSSPVSGRLIVKYVRCPDSIQVGLANVYGESSTIEPTKAVVTSLELN